MKKFLPRRILELAWLGASLLLLLFWMRSFIHTRYPYPWESWLQLPWQQKLQPFELTIRRDFISARSLDPRIVPQVAEADLDRSMRSAADWLLSVQEPSGHFKYWYDPMRDVYSGTEDDSFHRQAMASYALVLAYEMSGDVRYLESGRKSIMYLSGDMRTLESDKNYYYAGQQADLGGAALPMLTMMKLRELTGDTTNDETLKRLARFLIFLQSKYSSGEFKSTYVYRGNYDVESGLDWQSPISPGQAMLALSGMYRNSHDSIYKDSIDRGLKFYSNEKYWKQEAFLPWAISAFASMYSETGENLYADYVSKLTDYLIRSQNLAGPDTALGSFSSFPSITSASYLEGLGDAVHIAQEQNDLPRMDDYRQRAKLGYSWVIALQFDTSNTVRLPSPLRAIGGFPESRYDPQIRIDYNAHAISAFARGLRYVFARKPAISPAAPARAIARNRFIGRFPAP